MTQGRGLSAEIVAHKMGRKGNGDLVKAVLDETADGDRVGTVYLDDARDNSGCNRRNNDHNTSRNGWHEPLDVDMPFDIRLPTGAQLTVDDVNGTITVTGADVDSKISTVNGDIIFDGVGASSLETVNGKIIGTLSRASWEGSMRVQTVNGPVELTFPAGLSADVSGETVNGSVQSDFPITIDKGWGPKSFNGRIGQGGRRLQIETVNGGITIRKR